MAAVGQPVKHKAFVIEPAGEQREQAEREPAAGEFSQNKGASDCQCQPAAWRLFWPEELSHTRPEVAFYLCA
jgi:hypothetical protein